MLAPEPTTLSHHTIRLEPLAETHAEDLLNVGSDPDLWLWNPRGPFADLDDVHRWLADAHAEQATGHMLPFAIAHTQTGRAIGSTRYGDISVPHGHLEIGWTWIAGKHQRTAVNTACKLLLLGHAFDDLGAMRVQFKTDSRNVRSRRAIERLGAKQEGILRKHIINHDGSIRDSVYYSITDDEWPDVRRRLEAKLSEPPA